MNTTTHYLTQRVPSDPRDPLTLRTPRTLREAENNPMGWKQSGRDAFADEERLRQMFADADRQPESRSSVWAHRVIYAVALGLVLVVLWDAL